MTRRHPILLTTLALILAGGCAGNPRPNGDVLSIDGPEQALQPRIRSATRQDNGQVTLNLELARAGYVTYLLVSTQSSVSVLTPSRTDFVATPTESGPGAARLALYQAPLFSRPSAIRGSGITPHRDGTVSYNTSFPSNTYALVIVTKRPVSTVQAQAGLADIELRGPDADVLTRIARAIGAESESDWGAIARRAPMLANGL